MKLTFLSVVLACVAMASAWSFSSLYFWNDTKRPPVSLEEALAKAHELLGEDAKNRYCVGASLYGDETGSGEQGAWNLFFAATDGSKKHVFVDMAGESSIINWNGPVNVEPERERHRDLEDVRRRLVDVLEQQGIKASVSMEGNVLTVEYRTRTFQVYPKMDDGSYAEDLEPTQGPLPDGLWIQVTVAERPDLRRYEFRGPYWMLDRRTYFSSQPRKYFIVEKRYGDEMTHETNVALQNALGEQTPTGWGGE